MMRGRAACAVVALLAAQAASGQERAQDVSLDDFAVPTASGELAVPQLNESAAPIGPDEIARDKQLAVPGAGPAIERDEPSPSQLSQPGQAGAGTQLSGADDSRKLETQAVAQPGDSRPRPTTRLAGRDRCDPRQQEAVHSERCRAVLETRAAEFKAAEAPRLSAEQALLAERGVNPDVLAPGSPDVRLQLASRGDPDAESRSNQELASIYLEPPAANGPPSPAEAPPDTLEAIAEMMEGLQGQLPPSIQP